MGRPDLAAELNAKSGRTDPGIARHFVRVTFLSDNPADLPRAPTCRLVPQCRNDVLAPLAVGSYLRQPLPARTLVVLEAASYCLHLSAPRHLSGSLTTFYWLGAAPTGLPAGIAPDDPKAPW